jgi:TonB family protein
MILKLLALAFFAASSVLAYAQEPPKVYIARCEEKPDCDDAFATYLTAAMLKKRVPVTVVMSARGADWVLSWTVYREGITMSAGPFPVSPGTVRTDTSVQLVDSADRVVWAYTVRRGRGVFTMTSSDQHAAEAVATALKKSLEAPQRKGHRQEPKAEANPTGAGGSKSRGTDKGLVTCPAGKFSVPVYPAPDNRESIVVNLPCGQRVTILERNLAGLRVDRIRDDAGTEGYLLEDYLSLPAASEGSSTGGPFSVGGNVSAPIPIYKPEPSYSDEARKAGKEGQVVLMVAVDAEGAVSHAYMVKPLGFGLDEKALETVHTWKFKPGTRNGVPVPVRVMVEVNFRLAPTPECPVPFAFAEMDWNDPQKVTWERFATDAIYWWTRQGGSTKFPMLCTASPQAATYAIVWRRLDYPYSYAGAAASTGGGAAAAGTSVATAIHVEVYRIVRGQIQYPLLYMSKETTSSKAAFKDAAKYLTQHAPEP